MMQHPDWEQLVEFVFGDRNPEASQDKKYNSLGIWVEQDEFFVNFRRINIATKGNISNVVNFE